MKYVTLLLGITNYLLFAYQMEYNRSFQTWIWLLMAVLFLVDCFFRWKKDINNELIEAINKSIQEYNKQQLNEKM